jgi:hypothetical protein
MNSSESNQQYEVQEVGAVSPHSEALFEAGKAILRDSISSGREFCKSMIGTSMGAIPIYLGILTFLLPKNIKIEIGQGIVIIVPAIGFLIAATLFTLGYLPISHKFSLDLIEEIEAAFEKNIAYRKRCILSGMTIFIISTLFSMLAIIFNTGGQ